MVAASPSDAAGPIAYFSAEFALHQSLPIYAGGLGVLAGDHCKEASDLGIPLIGVGFMYPQGYFHQSVSPEGWQQEIYERLSWERAPIDRATNADGNPCIVAVPLGNRSVLVQVWRVRLGRVKLYLLDTDLEENAPWDRELSARLYGGDRETRVQQEIILGIGGVRALKALGSNPAAWHLNEGHAAFVVLQRIRDLIEHGQSFDAALEEVRRTTIFTTHTPVPAGHDAFPFHLVESHLANAWGTLGTYRDAFMALGHYDNGSGPLFNMTALALRTAGATNAVSRVHREVTRDMWGPIWPGVTEEHRPVRAITNGIHVPTWLSAEMSRLLDDHLEPGWRERHDDPDVWQRILEISDEDLWAARQALRTYLFAFIRERARSRWKEEHVTAARVVAAGTLLDPNALTIGFARRFTGYKRPELIFRNPERLLGILNAARRPVQIIFAGKAHPADETGKHHLQQVYKRATDPDVRRPHRVCRRLRSARGALPRPGMRRLAEQPAQAARGERHERHEGLDQRRAAGQHRRRLVGRGLHRPQRMAHRQPPELHRLRRRRCGRLPKRSITCSNARSFRPSTIATPQGIPRRWLDVVRQAMLTVTPRFSARRMVKQYAEEMYGPVIQPDRAAAAIGLLNAEC